MHCISLAFFSRLSRFSSTQLVKIDQSIGTSAAHVALTKEN